MTNLVSRLALVALALGSLTGAAAAADLYRTPAPVAAAPYPETIAAYAFNWTGAYVGANVGARMLGNSVSPSAGGKFNLDSTSAAGGLQLGYQFQSGNFVYGLEGDVGYGKNEASRSSGGGRVTSTIDWTGSARARLGFAFDRVLVYGTGGVGFANFESSGSGGGKSATKSDTRIGWTAGGGLEYAVTKNVSIRGEYLYADYGRASVSYPGTGVPSNKQDLSTNLVRLGVNFKF